MSALEWFLLGILVAFTPSLLVLAILLPPTKEKGRRNDRHQPH